MSEHNETTSDVTITTEPNEQTHTVSTAEAEKALGVKYQTLYRWAKAGDITVFKKDGPYGEENFYNREELLAMRGGKNKKSDPNAPANKLNEIVAIDQVNKALANLGLGMGTIQEQLQTLGKWHDEVVEAKQETIDLLKEKTQQHEQLGQKDQEIKQLTETIEKLETEIDELKPKKRKKWLGIFMWSFASVTILAFLFGLMLMQSA